MSEHYMASAMRKRWADPQWKERQRQRIKEGMSDCKMPGGSRHIRIDEESHIALQDVAAKRRTTVSELVRTYIVWGLENDEP